MASPVPIVMGKNDGYRSGRLVKKYKIELRHRARTDEPIPERHGKFLDSIGKSGSPWNLSGIGSGES